MKNESQAPQPEATPSGSDQLRALAAITDRLANAPDEAYFLLQVAQAVRALTGAAYASVGFVEGDIIHWQSAAGKPIAEVRGYRQPISQGLCGWVVRHGRSRRSADVLQEPDLLRQYAEMRSELDVPVMSRGEVIGVLSAESPAVAAFDDHHETLMAILAGFVALGR